MEFGHERLDVYQLSVNYTGWAYSLCRQLKGMDRRRFFEIARGSAMECAAIQDVLVIYDALKVEQSEEGKTMLHRIVSMLTKLAPRDYTLSEDQAEYKAGSNDHDCDYDYD